MAESAVKSAADWLGKLLVEEGKYLWGAQAKIEELQDELLWMQSFLRDADTMQYEDEIVRTWVLKIKEYVAEAEDIIDNFVIKVASRRKRTGWKNKLKRYSCILEELVALHNVASSIDALKLKISMLSPRMEKYGLRTSYGMKSYRSRETQIEEVQKSLRYRHLEDGKIIGLNEDADQIIDALKNSDKGRKVVAIHGMGGLGKTTLAIKVFRHDDIKENFPGGCAWAYISQQFQLQGVLQVLLAEITSSPIDMFAGKDDKELIPELRQHLKTKKCLVVLDDVWNKRAWDTLSKAFSTCGGDIGSRVLLTTRKKEVAEYVDKHALNKPKSLQEKESWELLLQSVGWLTDDHENDGHLSSEIEDSGNNKTGNAEGQEIVNAQSKEIYGTDGQGSAEENSIKGSEVSLMKRLGKEMVKHCNGLPLAIIVLGGILRKKETLGEWQSVRDNFTSYLRRGNEHGTSYMEVLVQSYNDLPYHLKPCFLYLASYPEDYKIHTDKLYWMWIAEGLVTWSHDRIAGTESLEHVANDYLSELAQTGMVEVMEKGSSGRIKSIRMHDLMRDVSLQKAVAENFLNVIDHRPYPDKPLSIASNFAHKRLLRLAIYLAQGTQSFVPDSLSSKAHRYLRSLLFIAGQGAEMEGSTSTPNASSSEYHKGLRSLSSIIGFGAGRHIFQQWMEDICSDFQWLRVLDIEGFCLEGRLTKRIKKLTHLRYLSLKGTKVSKLPSSIRNLRFLEILDLRVSYSGSPVKIPNTLWKLDKLSHLFLPSVNYEVKSSKMLRLDTLICLDILHNLDVNNTRLEDLQYLENLRELSFKGTLSDADSLKTILRIPALKSCRFQSCSLGVKGSVIKDEPNILSTFDCIRELRIVEHNSLSLEVVEFPSLLKVLHLESCKLEHNPMEILGRLPHLKDLCLGNSSIGTNIICGTDSFPSLRKLDFRGLVDLEDWTVEAGSMPNLNSLSILNCGKLKRIPNVPSKSVKVTCSPCVSGVEKYGTCVYHNTECAVGSQEEVIIGLQNDTNFLAKKLLDSEFKIVVLSGRPGIGKDTLAQTLCRHPDIRRDFDVSAWLYSTECRDPSNRALQELLRDLNPESKSEDLSQMDYDKLVEEIKLVMLRKKCLLILSTYLNLKEVVRLMWTFGDKCFEGGSKLLLIANAVEDNEPGTQYLEEIFRILRTFGVDKRSEALPSKLMAQSRLITRHLSFLKHEQMQNLFHQQFMDILEGNDALLKKQMATKMLQQCSGHLLSIKMLTELLATKKSLTEWDIVYGDLNSTNSCNDQPLSKIFSSSYEDLPTHLKQCFLYLANFPQDAGVSTERLFHLWIAAGFVRLPDDRDQTDEFLENLAESYLAELVRRGMVKVWRRGPAGKIKRCRLQLALNKCLEKVRQGVQPALGHSLSFNDNSTTINLAIHLSQAENNMFPVASTSSDQEQLEYVKSVVFSNVSDHSRKDSSWEWFNSICNHFRSLQVLDLKGVKKIKGDMPEGVENLTQLRYLCLKGTCVNRLPPSIEKLTNLQTLDLRAVEDMAIPDVLWKLRLLRHLYLPAKIDQRIKLKLVGLDHLQTLVNVHTDKVVLSDIPELKVLRKLSVKKIHAAKELDDMIMSLHASLSLTIDSDIINDSSTILSTLQNLHKVRIKGKISGSGGLSPEMFPKHLKELTLKHTKLMKDPVPVLEELSSLGRIFFDHGSFLGDVMTFSAASRRLTHLGFCSLSNLEKLSSQTKDIQVKSLLIINCWRLQEENIELKGDEMSLR